MRTNGHEAIDVVRGWCIDAGVEWEQTGPADLVAVLPGEQKLRTTVSVSAGSEAITFNAFVMRHPDENTGAIHRWLLERNRRIFALAYAIDQLGDIFLVGTLPARGLDAEAVDQLMGSVLLHADQAFNHLVEMGFASAIRAEWQWRLRTGESTANLAAFTQLAPPEARGQSGTSPAGPTSPVSPTSPTSPTSPASPASPGSPGNGDFPTG